MSDLNKNSSTETHKQLKNNYDHSFNVELATKYGVNAAIMLQNFAYWTRLNHANKHNFHDGRFWTYNTQPAFTKLFPYWSIQNIKTIINGLISNKLLVKNKYNKLKADRTNWYALTDLGLFECGLINNPQLKPTYEETSGFQPPQNAESSIDTHKLELTDASVETNRAIPDTNADTNKTLRKDVFSEVNQLKELVKQKLKGDPLTTKQAQELLEKHYHDKSKPKLEHIEWSLDNFIKHLESPAGAGIMKPVGIFMDRIRKFKFWEDAQTYTMDKDEAKINAQRRASQSESQGAYNPWANG